MLIRPVQGSDAAAWLEMRCDLWPGPEQSHAEEISRFLMGNAREPLYVLIAIDDQGRSAGFIELSIRAYAEGCDTDRVAFIEGWYVLPSIRGRRVGAGLIHAAESWTRSQGCVELGSDTEVNNRDSTAAHLAPGFENVGVLRCFRKRLFSS